MSNNAKKTNYKKIIFLSALLVAVMNAHADAALPRRDIKEGNRHYQNGDYPASKEKYSDALEKVPESDIINFNLGTALYKEEDYEKSIDYLQKVLLTEDDELKRNAYYNLGNALYKSGMTFEEEDISQTVSSLEKSLSQYERALSMDKDDEDVKHNYAYVQKELERLKVKQQEQQQDQKQCDLPKDKKDQQQDQQSQEEQESQQQQQKDKQQQDRQEEQKSQDGEQQNQQGQEDQPQEQQEKPDEGRGQEGEEDYNKQQEAGAQPQNAQELTQKEAQMLLESYQQAEEPQGLLNVNPRTKDARPVIKDW